MPDSDPKVVASRLEEFRRNLLDVSLRNRLINFRTQTKAGKPLEKVVEVYGENPVELQRILIAEGKAMSFVGKPDPRPPKVQPTFEVDDYGDAASLAALEEEAKHELDTFVGTGQPMVDQTDLKLNTHDTVTALQRKLTKIHRDAKVAVEEQGANILFLALGNLVWFESPSSEEERRAPLVMLPVTLERTNAGAFRLRWDGGELGGNLSIMAKLRAEFGIRLPEIPEEADMAAYFTEVAGAVRSQSRWTVDREAVALGFFSYAKYLMYRDLDAAGWPTDAKPSDHEMLGALLDAGFEDSEPGISEDEFLDPLRPTREVSEVYDADGSQTLAILEANTGRSMIVEGPPGTGKSQTITNLIAELIGAGKKVLFVAEKAAALDVVYRRLREANLGDACLELHSNKANKRSFYTELKRTVAVAAPKAGQGEDDLRKLEEDKVALNGYSDAVNTPVEGREVTPRHAMGRLVALGSEPSPEGRHDFAAMAGWTEGAFLERRELVEKLRAHIAEMGRPADHPYFGSTLTHLLPQDKGDLGRLLDEAARTMAAFQASVDALAEALRVEPPTRPDDVERMAEWVRFVIAAPNVKGVDVGRSDWAALSVRLREALATGQWLNELRTSLAGEVPATTLEKDVQGLRDLLRLGRLLGNPLAGDVSTLLTALDSAAASTYALSDSGAELAHRLGVVAPTRLADAESLSALAKRIGTAPSVAGVAVSDSDWIAAGPEVDEAIEAARRSGELHTRYDSILTNAAWQADVAVDLATIEQNGGSFFRFLSGGFRAAMARTAVHFAAPSGDPMERAATLRAIGEARNAEAILARRRGRMSALFGDRWQGGRSDATALAEISSWVREAHAAVAAEKIPMESLVALERGADPVAIGRGVEGFRKQIAETEAAISGFRRELVLKGAQMPEESSEGVYAWLLNGLRPALPELRGTVIDPEKKGFAQTLRLLDEVIEAQAAKSKLEAAEEARATMGPYWTADSTDWTAFRSVLDWKDALHVSVAGGALPAGLVAFFAEDHPRTGLDASLAKARADRELAQAAVAAVLVKAELPDTLADETLAGQRAKIDHWKSRLDDLPALIRYNALAAEAGRLGLADSVRLAEGWNVAGVRLTEAFERSWYNGVVREAVTARPAIGHFNRQGHEATVAEFRRLDDVALRLNRAKVALAHWKSVPRASAGGAIGWLKTQFELKQNHKPIRIAMERAGEAVQAIKPVFLMSPLSVAMYLPADGPRFDVVIFDEASQVKPEDAFGGILRAGQTIVVGDSKQMPPTSFFDKLTSEEVEDDEPESDDQIGSMKELESVLAMMSAKVPAHSPRRRDLRWHYRSRHDGLIATSNRLFYEDRLVVFPSPERGGSNAGLILRHDPATVYGRGGTRKNAAEAKAVAHAAQRHVREHPGRTLGIAAFSKAQQEAIQDEIDLLRRSEPAFAAFDLAHPFEPLFVKNLENVQGDERDVIYISVGYGRDESGYVPASFGPLNRDGGERRLNVLITRARLQCEVFTNIKAEDVRLTENAPRGVLALKTFLAFADTGSLDVPAATGMEPQSPFEESVLARLRAHGYNVEPQVGSCGFFIDMAVRHPDQPQRFVLGIECDGAMYHRARSARDRDKLRQAALESRGWRIHRIWSTDWFHNPEREFERLVKAVEAAIHAGGSESDEPSARPSEYVELERDETVPVEEAGISPYVVCELQIDLGESPLYELPVPELADYVVQVVTVEGPVGAEEVLRRIREAAGVARSGPRIQAAIDGALALAESQARVRRAGEFLYDPSATESPVRSRSALPAAFRKLELISPEEIIAALVRVVQPSFGIAPSEAIPLTAKTLGFERTTGGMAERIQAVLDAALTEGTLKSENGLLRIS
ncbi:DUF3320 domain-containing protein [bacterium]|nr:MAG: DUF3320 domain-containing protein [bacterium]